MIEKIILLEELHDIHPEALHYLSKFYSIGIPNSDKTYNEKHKFLHVLIEKNIVHENYYTRYWASGFCKLVSDELNLPVVDCGGLGPSWGAYVNLGKTKSKIGPKLYFYLSFLNNYYFVCVNSGIEKNEFGEVLPFSLTVSPEGDYKREMVIIEKLINNEFKNSKFLPFVYDSILIKDFQVPYLDSKNCSVHDAFFSKYENSFSDKLTVLGDVNYGLNK